MKWTPRDVIAGVIILGCFILKFLGMDSTLSWALIGIIAAYYGIDLTPYIKLGRNQKAKSLPKQG